MTDIWDTLSSPCPMIRALSSPSRNWTVFTFTSLSTLLSSLLRLSWGTSWDCPCPSCISDSFKVQVCVCGCVLLTAVCASVAVLWVSVSLTGTKSSSPLSHPASHCACGVWKVDWQPATGWRGGMEVWGWDGEGEVWGGGWVGDGCRSVWEGECSRVGACFWGGWSFTPTWAAGTADWCVARGVVLPGPCRTRLLWPGGGDGSGNVAALEGRCTHLVPQPLSLLDVLFLNWISVNCHLNIGYTSVHVNKQHFTCQCRLFLDGLLPQWSTWSWFGCFSRHRSGKAWQGFSTQNDINEYKMEKLWRRLQDCDICYWCLFSLALALVVPMCSLLCVRKII